jgi:hypothetical protein
MRDLFGQEVVAERKPRLSKDDYEGFVEKFKPKKTTDDCYTPPSVYSCVLDYVAGKVDLTGRNILRPFYPGGDYRQVAYAPSDVVVDNPPFSILAEIISFYCTSGVKFFLFAPHLTLFSSRAWKLGLDLTAVACGIGITYHNGAVVNTSFITNTLGDISVMTAPELYEAIRRAQADGKVQLPKYAYPPNVLMVTMLDSIIRSGIAVDLRRSEIHHCSSLEQQMAMSKAMFGSGFLLSDAAAASLAAAKEAAEKGKEPIRWELSDRELEIVSRLGA